MKLTRVIPMLVPLGLVVCASAAPPEETIVNVNDVPWSDGIADGATGKQFVGELLRLHITRYQKGTTSDLHSHINEQIMLVQAGRYRATIEGREHTLEAGDLIIVPSHALHTFEALEDSEHIEVFAPVTLRPRLPESQ